MAMNGKSDKQSVNLSERINMMERELQRLFSQLHLQEKLQKKLTPADFLNIVSLVKQQWDTHEKDLAYTFVQRLMMLDYRARYISVRGNSQEDKQSDLVPESDVVEQHNDELDMLFSSSVDSGKSNQASVHPMDVQMAVFHCSDSFLKQNMITKLCQCQYALPLLVPDPVTMDVECPLWTFRGIKKTWKIRQTIDNSDTVTMKSMPICKAETPMVSFLRLDSLSVSKSQLMNNLINSRHNAFFHRDCPGSTKSRHLMDGVAEITWYCPSGKPNDAFPDCTAFCNLHGDALLFEKQQKILTEKSSVNVVLVPTLKRDHKSATMISGLFKSLKPLIVLVADEVCEAVRWKEGKYKMGLKDRSQSDFCEELKRIIQNILSGTHDSFCLEAMAEIPGIRVDEIDEYCQTGKSAALKIMNLLQGEDVCEIKKTFLPCHGELWHKWCSTSKQLYRLKEHAEKGISKTQEQLSAIRKEQHRISCSELINLFTESLSSLKTTEKEYFLKWTQILIDALSTNDLSTILQSYDEKWSEVLTLKENNDKTNQLKTKQKELDEISRKLQSATFGLEHIYREMGQIYEAHASLQGQPMKGQMDWSKYPELAAELMISGHPMELMDGDAGHVPLKWIPSLLDEVIKKLGNKQVFVLSVLGIQSSGKSTMLNAMFGLQFAVSAGRCTRGAFMQLVKVSEEMKKDFKFDYMLVVDTEGLRALELAGNTTFHHDNELATFVVGLGNMTLINIFGENPSEMQDVLQIVVQAFMRMRKVKLTPSCVFVHQNVTDVAAAEMNMDGKRRLQDKLDKMVQLAAKEEVHDAQCFSKVIAFNVQEDVKYFAQLWEGSPPMAPPNPGYSESVQDLKNFILSKASKSKGTSLSEFKTKVVDLWTALLNEDFVFSFKNTHEISVYRKLEVQYGNWTWKLRHKMLITENLLYPLIENGALDKIEVHDLYMEMNKTYGEVKKDMTTYFDEDEDKEMLTQWRGRFEMKIKEFHDEQVKQVKRKLGEVIEQKKACKKLDEKKTEFEKKLLQKSKELAQQLKDKAKDEEELKKQFNSVWDSWVRDLTADTKPIEDITLTKDITHVLVELGTEWKLINESKGSGNYRWLTDTGDYSQYVCAKHTDQKEGQEKQQKIRDFIDNVEKKSLETIMKNPVAKTGYNITYLQEVAKYIIDAVRTFESEKKYSLKKDFTVDLVLYVFHRAEKWLTESHKTFQKNNDARTYVESKKDEYYNVFRSFCKGSSLSVVFGELICGKLKDSTAKAVYNKTATDLADEMMCNYQAFKGNRVNLEKHVLRSLAEAEDFNGFITYINNPKEQVETFIKQEVQKYIRENQSKAENIFKKNAEGINKLLDQDLYTATEKVKIQKGDIHCWVKEFSSLIQNKVKFNISCEDFSDIDKLDFLKDQIREGLKSNMTKMSSFSTATMREYRVYPDENIIDHLCNCCWVTCPFCSAVCTNTLAGHTGDKHAVPFHRPDGIKGWYIRGTTELLVDFCTTLVGSNQSFYLSHGSDVTVPYKQYQSGGGKYASWQITPDHSKLPFWKWFVCKFQKQLEDYHKKQFKGRGKIPDEWRKISKKEAFESLNEM